jgi:nicotinate-nucleotide pyrophosphorylase (carboxylating)
MAATETGLWEHPDIRVLIELALREDIGSGDITSAATITADQQAEGRFYAREDVVLAGVELLPIIFSMRGGVDEFELLAASGDKVKTDHAVARVRGRARTLLECERVSLNFLQRLSGVATLARKYADAVAGTNCKVLDTRKTTPGFRRLEKLAAAAGGVTNHRIGLFDAVLIKNNHITAAGGVHAALQRVREMSLDGKIPVEIETRTREELDQALAGGATHVLLDNLTPKQAAAEVQYIAGRAKVELSGNITLDTIRAYAQTGADFVSSGAITHQAQAVNFNFRIELR